MGLEIHEDRGLDVLRRLRDEPLQALIIRDARLSEHAEHVVHRKYLGDVHLRLDLLALLKEPLEAAVGLVVADEAVGRRQIHRSERLVLEGLVALVEAVLQPRRRRGRFGPLVLERVLQPANVLLRGAAVLAAFEPVAHDVFPRQDVHVSQAVG